MVEGSKSLLAFSSVKRTATDIRFTSIIKDPPLPFFRGASGLVGLKTLLWHCLSAVLYKIVLHVLNDF
jgi:hypothetical protein